ncbi:endonuclease/exonuclease/phosphatase family protein [Gandjariella thermophila]|uniref:Endonuclease n=1 Tax=Gandjariella thermophila TaxID=1931992 RepID=A0A4D4J6Q0_9PSEU|nr:endonuclease/exonuclease/phosphatase family protein [Gandjariella thermophila]GDY30792.1 endonuclease [Gandjariella thermophila]
MTQTSVAPHRERHAGRPRPPGGYGASVLVTLLAMAFLGAALLRLAGIDGNRYTVAALALTPYVVAGGTVLGLVALSLRRWATGGLVLLVAVLLAAAVAPRAFGRSRPYGTGTELRVLTANLYVGRGDAATVVNLVREHRVDVLSLQELTPEAVAALDRAGLGAELPYREFRPGPTSTGSGLAARYPLQPRSLAGPSGAQQPGALLILPTGERVELLAAHPTWPFGPGGADAWRRELAGLPEPNPEGTVRVLAGDFNATVDHAAFRRLLGLGYADAADQAGAGLLPTWPANGRRWPPVTIDHVLVDRRCPVDEVQVFDVPGSDHRALLARFSLPKP